MIDSVEQRPASADQPTTMEALLIDVRRSSAGQRPGAEVVGALHAAITQGAYGCAWLDWAARVMPDAFLMRSV
jgi:hypothetical protein